MDGTYQPIPLDDDHDHLSTEKEALLFQIEQSIRSHKETIRPSKFWSSSIWVIHGIIFSISITIFAASFCLHYGEAPRQLCTQDLSPYSPAESAVEYHTTRYNITPALKMSEYIGYGSDVDKAWDHITYDVGDQMITHDELDRLGLDPNSLKTKNPKTGEEGYRVGIQVFHQLHCLNLLRQDSYKEYYSQHGGDIEVEAQDLRGHLDHCIEILRIALMCQSDTGVFAFKYYEGFEGHWPDFSTLHTCRNFDAIREWAFENAVVFGDEE